MNLFCKGLLATALAMLVACPSRGEKPRYLPPAGGFDQPVTLTLVDEAGTELPVYGHRGQRWVAGEPGRGYQVRLSNQSDERLLVVLSVDGINAVTGQTAAPDQTGYVLAPWQTAEIDGWRKSMDEAARFVFTDLPDSYAARTSRPDNVGVIGIAVFAERVTRPVYPVTVSPPRPMSGTAARQAAEADAVVAPESMPSQRIGTGHGPRNWSPVSQTDFVRASRRPIQVTELRYDDEGGLRAAGVLLRQPWRPNAFPGGFVPDPPVH